MAEAMGEGGVMVWVTSGGGGSGICEINTGQYRSSEEGKPEEAYFSDVR